MRNKITNISVEKTQKAGEIKFQIDFGDDGHCCRIIHLPCDPNELSLALLDMARIIANKPEPPR